ncbi:MAG: hypothetical protein QOJ12_1328 [Thermoleophilales bacterium]|jgi:hypothetical protein|nr:hypothetical protein [Thermoleophilales bacterium]
MVDEETPTPAQDPQDKEITVAVPADRVAEFYAFYSRFLAGRRGRRGRGPGRHGHGHHGRRCGEKSAPAEPEATEV